MTSTRSERRSGNRSPGNERQPSDSSSGSGSPGSSGRHPQLGIDEDAAPRAARRRPDSCTCRSAAATPTCGAARPTPGAASIVSNMSATSCLHLVGDLVDGGGRGVEDRVTHDANRQNGHALSLPSGSAVRVEWWCGWRVSLEDVTRTSSACSAIPRSCIGIPLALLGAVFMSFGAQYQHRGVDEGRAA